MEYRLQDDTQRLCLLRPDQRQPLKHRPDPYGEGRSGHLPHGHRAQLEHHQQLRRAHLRLQGPSVPNPTTPGDPTGITMVSDQAIYIAGDYNKPQTIGSTVYPKQPAALMGDSINILSNAALGIPTPGAVANSCTNDCQSILTLGSAECGGHHGQCGVHRRRRRHHARAITMAAWKITRAFTRDWSGDTLNYRGSFVSLGTPDHVDGEWCSTGG